MEHFLQREILQILKLNCCKVYVSGASNAVRGITAGGSSPSVSNVIDYVTIAATGNATDFGDLTQARNKNRDCTGSPTRAIFAGGITPSQVNTIDFVEIQQLVTLQTLVT